MAPALGCAAIAGWAAQVLGAHGPAVGFWMLCGGLLGLQLFGRTPRP